jgi:hypothetical protein
LHTERIIDNHITQSRSYRKLRRRDINCRGPPGSIGHRRAARQRRALRRSTASAATGPSCSSRGWWRRDGAACRPHLPKAPRPGSPRRIDSIRGATAESDQRPCTLFPSDRIDAFPSGSPCLPAQTRRPSFVFCHVPPLGMGTVIACCQHWSRVAALGAGLLLAPVEAMATAHDDLPVLYGIKLTPGAVTVQVVSHGCTKPEDFVVEIHPTDKDTELVITRIRQDHCRMASHIVELSLDLPPGYNPEARSAQIKLMNRISFPGVSLRRN